MDPNIIIEQVGPGREAHVPTEDGASYLKNLKAGGNAPTGSGQKAGLAGAAVAASAVGVSSGAGAAPRLAPDRAAADPKERRRSPRYNCTGTVEFQVEGNDVRLWGALTDISLHGCYVEMSNTFPLDTMVNLDIESGGIHVRTTAKVRACYPFLGVGMCFGDMEPGQHFQLEQLLRALAGQRAILNSATEQQAANRLPDIVASADAWACLEKVDEFFKKNSMLSREEFYSIAKRVRRS